MAYKQNPGGPRQARTGGNIPTSFMSGPMQKSRQDIYKKELETVRTQNKKGGFVNTMKNIGTGLSHGWNSIGYDSGPSGSGIMYDSGGNKDLGASIGSAVSTAYNYATGDIPKKVTEKNKPKVVRKAQRTYLDK